MANFELMSYANDLELAQAVAAAWLDEVAAARRIHLPHYVALSGGRITRKFFAATVELVKARKASLNDIHFFWADERCVPPDDAKSNFRMANEVLFQPLGITRDRIHRIHGEAAPEVAASNAEAEILRVVAENIVHLNLYSSGTGAAKPSASDFHPVLDLIFLGMGEDGHVASLFPGEPAAVRSNKAVYRAIKYSPKPPPNRVTLGYAMLAVARQVWVLASGAGKTAALRKSLVPAGQTPLARVLQSRPHTRIFSDILLG